MSQAEIATNPSVIAEGKSEAEDRLSAMDRQADRIIAKWTFGGLVANLLPPPFDVVAVSAAFVRMGQRLARVYEVEITPRELRPLAKAMVKGVTGVALAAHIGTGLFKYVPGCEHLGRASRATSYRRRHRLLGWLVIQGLLPHPEDRGARSQS